MRCTLRSALVASALISGSLAVAAPAMAANLTAGAGDGGIAFGYSDGYWDQGHHWHKWRDKRQAAEFRKEHGDHFYARKHDADRDHGWHDKDTWWRHG
jgi:hypothetical protein